MKDKPAFGRLLLVLAGALAVIVFVTIASPAWFT